MEASNLDDVAAEIGYTATRILSAWYAGRSVYVPQTARADHPLALLIGLPALRALVRAYPSERIAVPPEAEDDRFRRDRRIALDLLAGQTCGEIADRLDLTRRRVEQIRADLIARGWLQWAARGRGAPVVGLENLGTGGVVRDSPSLGERLELSDQAQA